MSTSARVSGTERRVLGAGSVAWLLRGVLGYLVQVGGSQLGAKVMPSLASTATRQRRSLREVMPKLSEHVAQVPLDRAGANEQLGGDLLVGVAVPSQLGDRGLLGREVGEGLGRALAHGLPGGQQLTAGAQLTYLVSRRRPVQSWLLARDLLVAGASVLFSMWVTFASGYQAVYQALVVVLAGIVLYAFLNARRERSGQIPNRRTTRPTTRPRWRLRRRNGSERRAKETVMTGTAPFRVGKWLPSDQQVLGRWLDDLIVKADARGDVPLLPVVEEFRQLIERIPRSTCCSRSC